MIDVKAICMVVDASENQKKMDVVLCVLKPKTTHVSQPYSTQLYEILLLDSKTPPGDKVKPAKYMPMFPTASLDEEPRELVLTQLHKLTGIKGERALQLNWSPESSGSSRESLSQISLFFVPVGVNEKISKKFLEHTQNSPAFYPLEHVIEAVSNNSVHFLSPTRTFLLHLEGWLKEKHQKSTTVECLFRPRAEFRVHMTVHNPVFIPSRISTNGEALPGAKTAPFPPKIQLTANEALANMLSIEKCDIVVMNPLFGSGLPYKTKVNRYEINQYWPRVPDYNNIAIPSQPSPEPRWRDKYPVHAFAAEGNHTEVEVFLKQGYKHSQLDSILWAPIHYAAWYGNVAVVESLLTAGCSPNLCDGEMSTPLHIAARKGFPQLAQCLLRRPDINVSVRDKEGKRPIEICLSISDKTSRHEQVEQQLREAAARPSPIIEVFLMDYSSKTLELTSGFKTTVEQLNQQMMKEFNLPKSYTDVFTLWICSKSLELQLKLEHEVVKQLTNWKKRNVNMLTEANPSEEEPSLTWRKNVKVSVEKEKKLQHPKALDLLFHEAYHYYISGLYPCDAKDVVTFATIIFALQHQGAPNVKSLLSNLSNSKLKELVPSAMLRMKDSSHWVNKIGKEYANIKDMNKQQLKSQFLGACQKLSAYGSAFFTGNIMSQLRKSSISHTQCYIGVNEIGIHIINIQSKQMIQSLEYREITWKHIQEKSLLEVKVIKPESRESRNQRIPTTRGVIEIRTRQAGLIDHLMHQLSHKHGDMVLR